MILYQDSRITVFQSLLFKVTSTVVNLDDCVLIVDPAYLPHEIQEIQTFVNSFKANKQCYVLFTHGDYDHIVGYKSFPGAKTIGSLGLKNHPNKDNEISQIKQFDATYYICRDDEVEFPEIDIIIKEDAQQVQLGETTLTFYLAHGHTADSLFAVVDSIGLFLAGDYLSDFELPFIYQSAQAYEQTIQKAAAIIKQHEIQLLIPGHGEQARDRSEMERRIQLALNYLKSLKKAIISNDEATINKLEGEFPFYSQTTVESHRTNVAIMKRELGLK